MQIPVAAKILTLIGLGVCSFWSTATILKRSRVEAAQNNPVGLVSGTTTIQEGLAPPSEGAGGRIARPVAFSMSLSKMDVSLQDGRPLVSAAAEIAALQPKAKYVWSVLVKDRASGQAVWRKDYVDQIFWLTKPGKVTPTFREALPVGHGDYQVTVALFQITEHFPVQKLATARLGDPGMTAVGSVRDVLVP